MRHISGPSTGTQRYVVSWGKPVDLAEVELPSHIGVRGSGFGKQCIVVYCGGVAVDEGIEAIRQAGYDIVVTDDRERAHDWNWQLQHVDYQPQDDERNWIVGLWDQNAGNYYIPFDAEQHRLTGCYGEFGPARSMPRYKTLREAFECAADIFKPY